MILRTISGVVSINCSLDKIQEAIISEIKRQHPKDPYLQDIELKMEDIIVSINSHGGLYYEIKVEA